MGTSEVEGMEGAVLPQLSGILTILDKLIGEGVTVTEAAEKVAAWVDPSLAGALGTLAEVLTTAQGILSKV